MYLWEVAISLFYTIRERGDKRRRYWDMPAHRNSQEETQDFKTKKMIRMIECVRGNGISNVGVFIWAAGIGVRLNTILGNKELYNLWFSPDVNAEWCDTVHTSWNCSTVWSMKNVEMKKKFGRKVQCFKNYKINLKSAPQKLFF
jgi:hypothetical protein